MQSEERECAEDDAPARMKSAESAQQECVQATCLHLSAAPAAAPAPAPAADDQLAVFLAMRRGGGGAWSRRLMPRTISCFFGARCRNARCRFSHGDENSFVDVNTRWRRDSGASGSGGGAWSGKAGGWGARRSATLACYFGAHCRQPRCRSVSFSPPTLRPRRASCPRCS
jgi:hypothetical protein